VTEKGFFHGITQNLVLVGDIADRVGVMAAGQIVEEGLAPQRLTVSPPCRVEAPVLRDLGKGRRVSCHQV
jgi:ABC-type glutathione transport system ATPase component